MAGTADQIAGQMLETHRVQDMVVGTLSVNGSDVTGEVTALEGGWASVTTATVPASGSCAVQFVFKDAAGVTMAVPVTGELYLSKVATGLTEDLAGTSNAVLTNGVLTNLVAKGRSAFVTTAAGLLGLTITNGSADSFWVVFRGPNGKLIISDECVEQA